MKKVEVRVSEIMNGPRMVVHRDGSRSRVTFTAFRVCEYGYYLRRNGGSCDMRYREDGTNLDNSRYDIVEIL